MKKIAMKIYLFPFTLLLAMGMARAADRPATNTPSAIPWNDIGAKAGADYKGDGLAVTPTASGARLRCVFQSLDGEATTQGLWLTSTVTNTVSDRFRLTAMEVGRKAPQATWISPYPSSSIQLAEAGEVSFCGQKVRFRRPALTEEYSVSMDGVRQDFMVEEPPPAPAAGELVVKLAVTGARVEPAAYGARLALENSGRTIAYSRLRVTDATGRKLPARMEVCPGGNEPANFEFWSETGHFLEELSLAAAAAPDVMLAVVVNDAQAVYPVRIDPTFSDANWVSMGATEFPNGIVSAAATDEWGNLYIGGSFDAVGGTWATNIAQWNGRSWSPLGAGIAGSPDTNQTAFVSALAISGSTLYAAGFFTMAGGSAASCIAQWNGNSWSPLGSGINGIEYYTSVNALAVSGGTLYAGGQFTNAGGIGAVSIAQWNGSSWSPLGFGIGDDAYVSSVNTLAVSGGTLYAGGEFTTAGDRAATNIAQWNGSSWSPLGSGLSGVLYEGYQYSTSVNALAVSGGTLYAGGNFAMAGGSAASCIAQWDGSSWSPLGSGMSGFPTTISGGRQTYTTSVNALAVSGGLLYAGGVFTTAGGSAVNSVAQWNGTNWSTLGLGMSGGDSGIEYDYTEVNALAVSGGTLYAGGNFTEAGDSAADYVAQWNGSSWSAPGLGLNQTVWALAVSGSTLYAGGDFTAASGSTANYVAQWNGRSWSPLGSGMNSFVYALAFSGGTLYAGGDFTTAGGSPANYVAQWNGSSWSPLGSGMNDDVTSLAVSGSALYVGGYFTTAGGGAASYLAQWDGSSWSPLGLGMNSDVQVLAMSDGTLYAGGDFTMAGGSPANYVAQWNGSSWSPLGAGMNQTVYALTVLGSALYAGGDFTKAGGSAANYVAQWNGSSWSPLGSGIGSSVYALAVSGSTLYAGGDFTTAGGHAANDIAQWDGSGWSALGSGLNNYVSALAVAGGELYVGGDFTTAGTNASDYVAMLNLPPVAIITTNAAFGFQSGQFGFDVSGPPGLSVIIQASTNLQTWIPVQTNVLNGSGLLYFSDAQSSTGAGLRYYRVVAP
jgi:hypothetical protein